MPADVGKVFGDQAVKYPRVHLHTTLYGWVGRDKGTTDMQTNGATQLLLVCHSKYGLRSHTWTNQLTTRMEACSQAAA